MNYDKWLKELAADIALDQKGSGIQFIDYTDNGVSFIFDIPHSDSDKIEKMLERAGVRFVKRFRHTIALMYYPKDIKLVKDWT